MRYLFQEQMAQKAQNAVLSRLSLGQTQGGRVTVWVVTYKREIKNLGCVLFSLCIVSYLNSNRVSLVEKIK